MLARMPIAPLPSAAPPVLETPAVLDIEGSGSGPGSHPVEIGFVLAGGQTYCSLIKPVAAWTHWDPAAEKIHRIPRQTVIAHGRDVGEVATQLNARLHGLTVYCDGRADAHAWLDILFAAAGLRPSFRLDDLRSLLTDREAAFWDVIKRQVTTEMRLQRHRASSDARILQQTLMRLRTPPVSRPAAGGATPDLSMP